MGCSFFYLIEFGDYTRMEYFLLKIPRINFSSQNRLVHPHHFRHGKFFGQQVISNRLVTQF